MCRLPSVPGLDWTSRRRHLTHGRIATHTWGLASIPAPQRLIVPFIRPAWLLPKPERSAKPLHGCCCHHGTSLVHWLSWPCPRFSVTAGVHPVPRGRLQDRPHDPPKVQALPLPIQQKHEERGRRLCRDCRALPHADRRQEPRRECHCSLAACLLSCYIHPMLCCENVVCVRGVLSFRYSRYLLLAMY